MAAPTGRHPGFDLPINSAIQYADPKKHYPSTKHDPLRRYRRFSLHFRHIFISGCGESHTSISYSSLVVTMALFGLVFEIWAWDRSTTDNRHQTTDEQLHCLNVSHLLLQKGHLIMSCHLQFICSSCSVSVHRNDINNRVVDNSFQNMISLSSSYFLFLWL